MSLGAPPVSSALALVQVVQFPDLSLQFTAQGIFVHPPLPVAAQVGGVVHARFRAQVEQILVLLRRRLVRNNWMKGDCKSYGNAV